MKVIKATQQMLETRTLVLGFQGENLRTQLRIDCSPTFAEYPNATPALAVKPSSGETYPVFVERDGNEVVWDIVANNLVLKGDGELQLTFYKDNVIAKTVIGTIRVNRSLQIDGEMPDVVATWIENANRKLAEVDAQIVELEGMVDTATDAAERAEQSASTASAKAEQAAGSAATATAKATEATNAAGTATAKAAEAEQSAQTATAKATAAAESERIATAKAGEATTAAETATAKAEQATEAAEIATEKAGDASASATAAHASEINAAESADDALSAEVGANAAKRAAEGSATQAGASAQNAGIAAQTATQKATEATQSATDAEIFAGTATTKAEEAAASAQAAQDAQTAVEQTAEQLADSLEQIDQNTQDIAELDERKANIDGYYPDMTVGNAEQLNSSKYVENSEPYMLRTSGGTSDIGNREYVDAVVGGTLAWNQAVRDEASENSTDFADVVTVTDAVEDAAEVKVSIEPVQDLHGQDSPWPAGGGKNKCNAQNPIVLSAAGNIGNQPCVISAGTYTYSATTSANVAFQLTIWTSGETQIGSWSSPTSVIGRHSITFTISEEAAYIRCYYNGATTISDIQVESESTATSYAPYSNICPISGWDEVNVWDDSMYGGTVDWNQQAHDINATNWRPENGVTASIANGIATFNSTIVNNGLYSVNYNPITNGHIYYIGFSVKANSGVGVRQTISSAIGFSNNVTGNGSWISSRKIIRANADSNTRMYVIATTADGGDIETKNIMLCDLTAMFGAGNEPSTVEEFRSLFPNDYYAYNAGETMTVGQVNGEAYRHYTIEMPTEAGTVYGGELTVNKDGSGQLVVDRAEVDLGTLNWTYISDSTINFRSYENIGAKPAVSAVVVPNAICSALPVIDYTSISQGIAGVTVVFAQSVQAGRIWARNTSYTDAASFKVAMTGVKLVYELETTITYQLTATQVRTLLGTNNVWSDAGQIALTYTGTDEHLTLESGKQYLSRISGTDSMLLGSGQEITAVKGTDNVFDLTKMFGTAVADYVYGQGAAFFRKWFPSTRYQYNAGELLSVEGLSAHDMVGFNLWDEEWEVGAYSSADGTKAALRDRIRSKNFIPVFPSTNYYKTTGLQVYYYDHEKNFISWSSLGMAGVLTTPTGCYFMTFNGLANSGTTYKNDICISLAHNNSRNGEYEPYEKHSYPLDSTVVLRGIPKVGANGVYWDGDRYLPDGTVERRYGVVEMGQFRWMEYSGYPGLFYINVTDIPFKVPASNTVIANAVMIGYQSFISRDIGKTGYTKGYFALAANRIYVADDTYTGNVSEFKAAMQGVLLVYELATPTTETAQPYHSTQWVSDWGTEEFVSTGIVPVGHETRYPANLRDKLQHLPDAASGNGSYLITQTDGQMVLTPFPAPPSTTGNYVLKATVVNGVATYTWEVAT